MDSDREASSGNESDSDRIKDGPKSPASSRSVSQASSHGDAASYNSESPQSPDSRPNSSNSRRQSEPQSPDNRPDSPASRPQSQNSSVHTVGNNRSRSQSPHSEGPRSPSPYSSESQSALRNGSKRSPSHSSRSSSNSPDRMSSNKSESSRGSRKARKDANLEDGNSSDSSLSSMDSDRMKKTRFSKAQDTQAEEISDGDMELDNDKDSVELKKVTESNITHDADDLSDVSDLDESIGGDTDKEDALLSPKETEYSPKRVEKTHRTEEGEEQLDFEAEDGECADAEAVKDKEEKSSDVSKVAIEISSDTEEKKVSKKDDKEEPEEGEELEEGEVSDEDEVRPEETEPRPVCRFFSRGQCTWGASCRFLHPGVTDKGNYTMFEMIRPVVPGEFGREDRAAFSGRPDPPAVESAWERGLRTAKEMLRKSIKRKEQDIDFEEKKMNLSLAQEEFDKENGYYPRAPSPEPRYTRHPVPADYQVPRASTDEYFGRRQVIYETEYPPRDRARPTFREMPPSHRPHPDYRYEEEVPKQRRPKREVIVQRTVEERPARADDWSDPWMRSKSPGQKKATTGGGGGGGGKRSYSSGSSYSSSSSSRSSSRSSRSSYRSRSRSPRHHRSRAVRGAAGGGSTARGRHAVSPTLIVSERKAANERAALMNPPAPRKKAVSPGMMRVGAQNPPAPTKVDGRRKLAAALARVKTRRKSSRSTSGSSSGSSSSDTDSTSSSSSSRDNSPPNRRAGGVDLALAIKAKELDAFKGNSDKRPIKLTLKNSVARKPDVGNSSKTTEPSSNNVKKRMASSPPPGDKNKKGVGASSRREELLKQLKAVEDAIAKKRSKVN